jgi:putative ABC transport system permease protein
MLKKILFYFNQGISDLFKNKGRSFLTSLGIIIGVYSVVLLLAVGEGLKVYISNQFESIGSSLIYVLPGKISDGGAGMVSGKKFAQNDYLRLRKGLPTSVVVPANTNSTTLESLTEKKSAVIVGSTREIFATLNCNPEKGRVFSKSEEVSGRKVVVLGAKIAEKLFNKSNPVNQILKIRDLRFKVVGVIEKKGTSDLDDHVFAPYKTVQVMNNDKTFMAFYIKPPTKEDTVVVAEKTKRILLKTYEADDFSVSTQEELLRTISCILNILNIGLAGIAAISLLVGGIGITNIMYVTVTERTKEIGIRRAIGATQKDILFQFLVQSVLLTTLGGVLALLLAFASALALYSFFPVTITQVGICLGFFVSFFIGVIFGVLPALKAAKLSPVEAIRYE